MTREQIELIGLRTNDDMTELYGSDNCFYCDLDGAIWCGIFNFCGCGDRGYELERIYKTLKILNREDRLDREEIYPVENGYQIYLYLLDKFEFTEHGYSIYGSWLTEKGKALMYVLRHILGHDVEDAEL